MIAAAPTLIGSLNREQLEAATSEAKHALVIAPPGSGKTRVLTARLVWLLREKKMPSNNVLALVFTRAAAAELRRRVVDEVGEDLASLLTVCTFHSLALKLLRSDESLGIRGLQVASDDDEREVFDSLFAGPERRPEAKKVGKRKLRAWLTDWSATACFKGGPAAELANTFWRRLHARRIVSRDELLPSAIVAISEVAGRSRALDRLREFKHVLVDEGHDMTPAELSLVQSCGHASTVVMDPRQAIYGWRGADVGAVVEAYEHAAFYVLRQTYRFGPAIATLLNEMPRPTLAGAETIDVQPADVDDHVEVVTPELAGPTLRGIVTTMAAFMGRDQVAVLCRTHIECERVAAELGDLACVVRREGSRSLAAAVALARLVLDHSDDAAFRVLWRWDSGDPDTLRLIERTAGHARSLYAVARRNYHCTPKLAEVSRWSPETCFGFMGYMIPDDVAALPLQEALDALADREEADAFADIGDRVAVSTIHSAKGREWDGVVVLDFRARDEEDERVRFVACSRARRDLVVINQEESFHARPQ